MSPHCHVSRVTCHVWRVVTRRVWCVMRNNDNQPSPALLATTLALNAARTQAVTLRVFRNLFMVEKYFLSLMTFASAHLIAHSGCLQIKVWLGNVTLYLYWCCNRPAARNSAAGTSGRAQDTLCHVLTPLAAENSIIVSQHFPRNATHEDDGLISMTFVYFGPILGHVHFGNNN